MSFSSSNLQTILPPPDFTFTPSDVRLKINYKNAPVYAHVSSQAMALASPVWKNFLFPPWSINASTAKSECKCQEKNIDTETKFKNLRFKPVEELDFTEDDPEALLVLLCIAHSNFESVLTTRRPPKGLMANPALLCDKYLCQDLLRPWVGPWIDKEWKRVPHSERRVFRHCSVVDYPVNLLVGWVFRTNEDHEYFKDALRLMRGMGKDMYLPNIPDKWPLPVGIMGKSTILRDRYIMTLPNYNSDKILKQSWSDLWESVRPIATVKHRVTETNRIEKVTGK